MTTFEMIKKSIEAKKKRGALNDEYIKEIKMKMDIFLMNNRLTEDEYNDLTEMLN